MKSNHHLTLFILLFIYFISSVRSQHISAGDDFTVCYDINNITLTADIEKVLTERYKVLPIPFNWDTDFSNAPDIMLTDHGVTMPLRIDDRFSDPINLPFPIYFYGEVYNQIVVGSNGDIIFEPSIAGTFDSWLIAPQDLIPNHTLPYWDPNNQISFASIMGAYHDMDISIPHSNSALKYKVTGNAPNRQFIIIYNEIPHHDCIDIYTSQQIIFNENDNSIEVHIKNKPVCSTWNDGLATLGIQNETLLPDTCGNYPGDVTSNSLPNRNTGVWSINETASEAYKFISDNNVIVKWTDNNGNIVGNTAKITIPFESSMTYTLEVIYEDCHQNTYMELDEITVSKLPEIKVNLPETGLLCVDETKILDGTILNAGDFSSIIYTWFDDNGQILSNVSKLTISTAGEYRLNINADGCSADFVTTIMPYPYKCQIPQGISPNNDGLNDFWYLDYLAQQIGISIVEIFDRRGVLVYQKQNYSHEFNGKNKHGKPLPAATYYYVIKLKDGQNLTGWLYLSR